MRGCPTTAHARRSETGSRERTCATQIVNRVRNQQRLLYGVAALDADSLAAAEEQNLLTDKLTISQLENWKRERSGLPPRERQEVIAQIAKPADVSLVSFIRQTLQELADKGIPVTFVEAANDRRKEANKKARDLKAVQELEDRYGIRLDELHQRILSSDPPQLTR